MFRITQYIGLIVFAGLISVGCGNRGVGTDPTVESIQKDKQSNAEELIRLNVYALEIFRLHTGAYPESDPGLIWLREQPPSESIRNAWRGPYLPNEIPVNDPWDRPLVYQRSENGSTYTLKSLGSDPQVDADDILAQTLMPRLFEEIARTDNP